MNYICFHSYFILPVQPTFVLYHALAANLILLFVCVRLCIFHQFCTNHLLKSELLLFQTKTFISVHSILFFFMQNLKFYVHAVWNTCAFHIYFFNANENIHFCWQHYLTKKKKMICNPRRLTTRLQNYHHTHYAKWLGWEEMQNYFCIFEALPSGLLNGNWCSKNLN